MVDSGEKEDDRRNGEWASAAPVSVAPLTVLASDEIEDALLASAGARPQDRDTVDLRIFSQITERTGGLIDSQDDVGGWPELAENTVMLDFPADPSGDADGDGYTNLEAWLHEQAENLD
ncbi:MAG: hypothetical protein ACI8RZ_000277 [Myxococcota bacterium]